MATVIAVAIAGASVSVALAKLVDVSLDVLVHTADVVVVARVTDLTQEHDRTLATADVLEILDGTTSTEHRVRFVASRTYAEDFSAAHVGEVSILFLANHAVQGPRPAAGTAIVRRADPDPTICSASSRMGAGASSARRRRTGSAGGRPPT